MKQSAAAWISISVLIALILAAGLVARPLVFPAPAATWFVAAEAGTAPREGFHAIEVRLAKPKSGTFLKADLHGLDVSRRYLGYVAGSSAQEVSPGRRNYRFDIRMPDKGDLAYIQGVIYLSRLGTWESRILSAQLRPVPVADRGSIGEPHLRRARILPEGDREEPVRRESVPLQVVAAMAWAASALLSLLRSRDRRSWVTAVACLLACAWEFVMPESALSGLLRLASAEEGLYGLRRGPQVLLSLAAVAAGLAGAILIVRRSIARGRWMRGLAWLGLYCYACVAILRIVSEHDLDALFANSIAGIQVGQTTRLCFAALALAAQVAGQLSPISSPDTKTA